MIVVIGCGNTNRSDDGAGPGVIRVLRERGLERPEVKLLDAGTDGMAVMFNARGCTALLLVDAVRNSHEPGAIYEVPGAELERAYEPGLNLHDFRWDAALHAGRKIFRESFPTDVTVLLIQAQTLDMGIGLSAPVAAAVDKVATRIATLVQERVAGLVDHLRVERGGLYLPRAVCARYFPDLESVVLLRRGDDLLVLPVNSAAVGGYLLKQRNSSGDRVVLASEFFRENGLEDDQARDLRAEWSENDAALVALATFAAK